MSYSHYCHQIRELDQRQMLQFQKQFLKHLTNMEDANRFLRCIENERPKEYSTLQAIQKRIQFVLSLTTDLTEMKTIFYRFIRLSSPSNIVLFENILISCQRHKCLKCNRQLREKSPMKHCRICNYFVVEFYGNRYRASYCYALQRVAIHIPPHILHEIDYPFLCCNCHRGMVLVPVHNVLLIL